MKISYLKDSKLKYIISLSDEDMKLIKEGGDITSYSIRRPNSFIMVCKEEDE